MVLSVIIPNFNGASFLPVLFTCLAEQTAKDEFYEILIVDNGSTDNSWELLKTYCSTFTNLRIFSYTDKQSSYAARNYGVVNSSGKMLVFTDADCCPNQNWVQKILDMEGLFETNHLVSGSVVIFPKGEDFNIYEWFDFCTFLRHEQIAKNKLGVTANLAVSRKVFDKVNGFNEFTSGGDADFCRRVNQAGFPFKYVPDWQVKHPARASYREIMLKIKRVARGVSEACWSYNSRKKIMQGLLKHTWAMLLHPNLWRVFWQTLRKKPLRIGWTFKFFVITIMFGVSLRFYIIYNILTHRSTG